MTEKFSERFKDISILKLDVSSFDGLNDKNKQLVAYLSEAGLWGRAITMEQLSEHNMPLFANMMSLYEKTEKDTELNNQLYSCLFVMFSNRGVYDSTTGERLKLDLTEKALDDFKANNPNEAKSVDAIKDIWFSDKIKQFRTVQKSGVDTVTESGVNFYSGVTADEVKDFRANKYPVVEGDKVPPYGFNDRLFKNEDGVVESQTIKVGGLYGKYVEKIVENLQKALEFTENEEQHKSIASLIKCYHSGDAADFDAHCVDWVKDKKSEVYFINGFIESYDDPLSVGCTFESLIGVRHREQTAKVNKIIGNIQWFEDNMPFDKKFKKEKASGLSALAVNVVSSAGRTAPSLPLGINLPNSDWIREEFGSKSVNLLNVSAARAAGDKAIREIIFLPKYHNGQEKYGQMTNNLHTDLHEIAGHGSGKVLPGVSTDVIGPFYATLEETRADLVALYFMGDKKLKDMGIYTEDVNVEEATEAQYVSYLTNGAIAQLRRIELGKELTQAHFRNRQLISNWVLENSDKEKVKMVNVDGKHFIEINDLEYVKNKFGELLTQVQEIKSTGDFKRAEDLIMKYGTAVNQDVHKDILARMKVLNLPNIAVFITPEFTTENGKIVINQPDNFFEQQMSLHKRYNETALAPKPKKRIRP